MRGTFPSNRSAPRPNACHYERLLRLARATSFFCVFFSCVATLPADEPVAWHTGADFLREWASPVGVTWSETPIRAALAGLARSERIAMLLDRRIDPQRTVTFAGDLEPLDVVCQRIAGKLNAGVCRVGPVAYFGPTLTTQKLATIAAIRRAEIESPNMSRRDRFGLKPLQWEALAEPRTLVRNLAAEAGLAVTELDRLVPHDLWPAQSLPPLVWSDRLTLILAGFDLTFHIDDSANQLTIVPMPNDAVFEKTYAVKGSAAKVSAELTAKFPRADVRAVNGRVAVKGSYEDHEMIERLVRGEKINRQQVVDGDKVYTLRIENQPIGGVMRAIAERLKLAVDFAPDTQDKLAQRVTFSVENALLDDLLAASLRNTGLKHEIRDGRLLIRLAP